MSYLDIARRALAASTAKRAAALDPRPDLADDAEPWGRLLTLAHRRGGTDPDGMYGSLLGMRCMGVRLALSSGALRLEPRTDPPATPPRWVTAEEYALLRDRWLTPHRGALLALFREVTP